MNNCKNCGVRPCFNGHEFCGKTCAQKYMQNQPKCKNCGVNPRFSGHEFCGKTCAQEYLHKCKCGNTCHYNGSSYAWGCYECIN